MRSKWNFGVLALALCGGAFAADTSGLRAEMDTIQDQLMATKRPKIAIHAKRQALKA
jgi:hypothetical protein